VKRGWRERSSRYTSEKMFFGSFLCSLSCFQLRTFSLLRRGRKVACMGRYHRQEGTEKEEGPNSSGGHRSQATSRGWNSRRGRVPALGIDHFHGFSDPHAVSMLLSVSVKVHTHEICIFSRRKSNCPQDFQGLKSSLGISSNILNCQLLHERQSTKKPYSHLIIPPSCRSRRSTPTPRSRP
jgi:hypothetical protein